MSWRVAEKNNDIVIRDEFNRIIADVDSREVAALIAAAPDMLVELETLLVVHQRKVHNKLARGDKPAADLAQSHVDRIAALIARAKGTP
jgi:hypothetical protein